VSPAVDAIIEDLKERLIDKDLARLFENAFPNTLDTTVRWHIDGHQPKIGQTPAHSNVYHALNLAQWDGPHTFIVTGDINAEWLRDSTNQLAQYQPLAKRDKALQTLILGAINTQAEFVIAAPYCNAFQPPAPSGLVPTSNGRMDSTSPTYEPSRVFECKYELDSLAAFLRLSNDFYNSTGSAAFVTRRWLSAVDTLLEVLTAQSLPTFDAATGAFEPSAYTFQRNTNTATETLPLRGNGNPLAGGTGLVRSAFRPSDDATIFGFLVPANAMMAVELRRTAALLSKTTGSGASAGQRRELATRLAGRADAISKGVWEHGVVDHAKWGRVFAYEVDGYGSRLLMDDANVPSLLALPLLGFAGRDDPVYRATRRMLLDPAGNPYYLRGENFRGIGGPHIGLTNAWPMALLVQAMTSDDDDEIMRCIGAVKNVSTLGLINESVNVLYPFEATSESIISSFPRSCLTASGTWFAWANSVFAQTILDVAKRKPHLLFGKGAKPYDIE
jgi:hypothetical protein